MALGRIGVALGCVALATVPTPADAQVTTRNVVVTHPRAPVRPAAGFYRIQARGAELLSIPELEAKAIRSRSFQQMNTLVKVFRFGWIIIPRCGDGPDARGREDLTSATPSPLEVTCP